MTPAELKTGFRGPIADFLFDTTAEIDLEGSRDCGKTWACLWKELEFLKNYPGMWSFLFRYSDTANSTKLRPALEQMILMRDEEIPPFDSKELCYLFPNGSRAFSFGLKAADAQSRYAKLRGLGVSRVYNDQAEETPADIASELRFALRQPGFPHQLTFSPNPPPHAHWIADQRRGGFPENNRFHGRRYYSLSIYDNAHNLPPETITQLEATYPPEHALHKSLILGQRGVNVIGESVYGDTFIRRLHVRPIDVRTNAPILEGIECGKKHPCYVAAQRFYTGGIAFLGGIIGQGLFLEDFLPLVKEHRAKWFPSLATFRTCCSPQGAIPPEGSRYTQLTVLREAGFTPWCRENGNAPDVVLAMIERLAGYMRRRTIGGEEAFAINSDPTRWLRTSREGIEPCPFMDEAFEAGYTWDEHPVSVGNKTLRQPHADEWFEFGMHCAEQIELNFGTHQTTDAERDKRTLERQWSGHAFSVNSPMGWAS